MWNPGRVLLYLEVTTFSNGDLIKVPAGIVRAGSQLLFTDHHSLHSLICNRGGQEVK